MNAVYLGDREMVQLLLDGGTDVNHKNYLGRTPCDKFKCTGDGVLRPNPHPPNP